MEDSPRPAPPAAPVAAPAAPAAEPLALAPADLKLDRYKRGEDGRPEWAGEELEYQIRWNGLPAGRAVLRVKQRDRFPDAQGPETWLVRLDIRSNRAVTSVYPVRNKAQSRIDVKGGFSRLFANEVSEGEYQAKERARFDYTLEKLEALYEYPQWFEHPASEKEEARFPWKALTIPLNGKVLDPLSAVYYLRALDLKPGQTVVLPICADRRVWNTPVKVEGRETVDIPGLGPRQPCLVLLPECEFNGLFVRRAVRTRTAAGDWMGAVQLWVHEGTKVPVKLAAETPLGSCEALLDSHRFSPFDPGIPGPAAPQPKR